MVESDIDQNLVSKAVTRGVFSRQAAFTPAKFCADATVFHIDLNDVNLSFQVVVDNLNWAIHLPPDAPSLT